MSLREKMFSNTAPVYLPVFHPSVGHGCIRSLSEYERSCLENSIASVGPKKSKVNKDIWLLSARAKLLMFCLCEPEFLFDKDNSKTGPNPDAFQTVFTTVLNPETGKISFDSTQLKTLLTVNGAITGCFSEPAMKHVGMSNQDFEELLGNSEKTE